MFVVKVPRKYRKEPLLSLILKKVFWYSCGWLISLIFRSIWETILFNLGLDSFFDVEMKYRERKAAFRDHPVQDPLEPNALEKLQMDTENYLKNKYVSFKAHMAMVRPSPSAWWAAIKRKFSCQKGTEEARQEEPV